MIETNRSADIKHDNKNILHEHAVNQERAGILMGKYDDIINLPHHVSNMHRKMSMEERAAQFSPFAALTGYDDAVLETERLTDTWIPLSEEVSENLNKAIRNLMDPSPIKKSAKLYYFQPDKKKSGGAYLIKEGIIRRIDTVNRIIEFTDKTKIEMKYITKIDIIESSDR